MSLSNGFHLLHIYSIYDQKNGLYQVPYCEFSDIDAVRRFDGLLKNTDTFISRYKDDFSLYRLGILDLDSGDIKTCADRICDFSNISDYL